MDKAIKKLKNLPRRFVRRCDEQGITTPFFRKCEQPNMCIVIIIDGYGMRVEYCADTTVVCSIIKPTHVRWRGIPSVTLVNPSIDDVFEVFLTFRDVAIHTMDY